MTYFYVHKHVVTLLYGGPEEGGWWYDAGTPTADWQPLKFEDEEKAYAKCRELNASERERAKRDEDYDYTSVLSYRSNHYGYSVTESSIPQSYPETRPHYE
jgi:hypothetical protein